MSRCTIQVESSEGKGFPVRARRLALAVCVATILSSLLYAIAGDLDPSFGTDGKVITDFGNFSHSARALAIQDDGKIVAAGESSLDFGLARYNPDGSLDSSFDGDGKVTTDIGPFDVAFAVAVQVDGKIVAAGGTSPSGYCCQFALARYNADGSLDTTFDADGKVTTAFTGDTRAFAMAIQPDGKIVAAGGTSTPFSSGFALARYNSDGSLDTSFDGDGKVTTAFGGFADVALGLVIQPDGRLVAAGKGGASNDFVLARYDVDGSLDSSFGTGGRVTTDFGGFDGANGLALQTDGKIVAAGQGGFFTRFALARYNADGSLDTTFDGDGMVTTTFFGENVETAEALALQKNGKIVTVGTVFSQFDPSFALARFNTDGSLDASFGNTGKVTTDFGDPDDVGVLCPASRKDCSNDAAHAVAIQRDGQIVAAGGAGPFTPSRAFALARYVGDPTVTEVSLDISPQDSSNTINLGSKGVVAIAILTTDTFDGTSVDPSTVCFGDDDHPAERACYESHSMGHIEDVNKDKRPDQVLHFDIQQTGIDTGDTTACLTGTTFDGDDVHGCDSIVTR